jgi:hypothetical protein
MWQLAEEKRPHGKGVWHTCQSLMSALFVFVFVFVFVFAREWRENGEIIGENS